MKKVNSGTDLVFIHPPFHRRLGSGIIPPFGLLSLASSLGKSGYSSKLIDCSLYFADQRDIALEEMKRWLTIALSEVQPQTAIGIGPCTTTTIKATRAVAEVCQERFPHLPILCGGPLTLIPNLEWIFFDLFNCSAIIKGDGEIALPEILDRLIRDASLAGIPGVMTSLNDSIDPYFIDDLDSLAYPDWDQIDSTEYSPSIRRDLFQYPFAPIIGSRGCCHRCSFCLSGQLIKYRRHSLEYIIDHASYLKSKHGVRSLIFYDDCLFPPNQDCLKTIHRFCSLFREKLPGVLWQFEVIPATLGKFDESIIEDLSSAGCRQLNIGMEKSSKSLLKSLGKNYSLESVTTTCDLIRKVSPNIRLAGTFILGGPGESKVSIKNTIRLSQSLGLIFAHFYPLLLYPGTVLYNNIVGDNGDTWFRSAVSGTYPWGELVYESQDLKINDLLELAQEAYSSFYESKSWEEVARKVLGENFAKVHDVVKKWSQDRFRLG